MFIKVKLSEVKSESFTYRYIWRKHRGHKNKYSSQSVDNV